MEVMLLMMNVVMNSECCPLDWKRSTVTPPQIVMWYKYVIRDCISL